MNRAAFPTTQGWLFLLVLLMTVFVYYPGLSGDYMFDDMINVLENPRLEMKSLDMDSIRGAALSSGSGALRRPVSMLSLALVQYFFGESPYPHKVFNLIVHLLTGAGLFLLCRLILQAIDRTRSGLLPEKVIAWLPLIVTSLWLVHPLDLTSVLYIVQRMTSLASLFMVCGLCLYMVGRLRMLEGRRGAPWIISGLLFFGGLAIFSKEIGVLLPLFMLVLELTLFRFRNGQGKIDLFTSGFFSLTVAIPGLIVIYVLSTDPAVFLSSYQGRDFTLTERLLTESRVIMFYLKMIIAPSISELGLQHDDIPVSRGIFDPPTTAIAIIALTGMLLAALALLKRQPLISLGILWFFSGHMLESTVLPLEIAHEHRNYLASFGIILAMSGVVIALPLEIPRPVLMTAIPFLFLCLFSYTTWLRAGQWSDNVKHAVYEARHHPDSFRSVYGAGRIYARLALAGKPEFRQEAYNYLERAANMENSGIMSHVALIHISYLFNDPVNNTWYEQIHLELQTNPVKHADLNNLYELMKCPKETCALDHENIETTFRLIFENPGVTSNRQLRAAASTLYGYYAITHRHDFDTGRFYFGKAVELAPKESQYQINLIELLIEMQQFDAAEQRLASFRSGNTHGGNSKDFENLQQELMTARNKFKNRGPH